MVIKFAAISASCAILASTALCPLLPAQVQKSGRVTAATSTAPGVDVPQIGFVVASGKELRPLWGHASALGAGPSLLPGHEAQRILMAPTYRTALVATASGWLSFSLKSKALHALGKAKLPSIAAVSDSGASAAIYVSETRSIDVYGGLPDMPALLYSADVSVLSLPVVSAAVNNDGSVVAIAVSDGRNGAVFVIRNGLQPTEIAQTGSVSAIRFVRDTGTEIIFADRTRDVIVRAEAGQRPIILADAARGVSGPVDLLVDDADGRVFVANATARTIVALSSSGELLGTFASGCTPARIARIGTSSLLTIAQEDSSSVWLLDTGRPDSGSAFIPVVD